MKSPPPRVAAPDAIATIRKCNQSGVRILGVDGFTVVPEGFRADLDLILDVSDRPMSADEAAAESIALIEKHARSDVIWEVWTDN